MSDIENAPKYSDEAERLYDLFRDREFVFTSELIRVMRFNSSQSRLVFAGTPWICAVNSMSLSSAKVLLSSRGAAYNALSDESDKDDLSLVLSFSDRNGVSETFSIKSKLESIRPYAMSQDFMQATLSFLQRPDERLIKIVGTTAETNMNFSLRREERISITAQSKREIHLMSDESTVYFQMSSRRCAICDLSFSGAKIIVMGLSQFIAGKSLILKVPFYDPTETFNLDGTVVAVSAVEGRKELVAVSIRFSDHSVPFAYKSHINHFLAQTRREQFAEDDAQLKEMME